MGGFIYIINTVGTGYQQGDRQRDVPTIWENRLVFGPCKVNMRPKMKLGDYVFGISPSITKPRRIVLAAKLTEILTFEDAYTKYQNIWDDCGIKPICVKPVSLESRSGMFPASKYEHLDGAKHGNNSWKKDIPSFDHDRCFVCEPICNIPWLGKSGPIVTGEIINFLRQCEVFGATVKSNNSWATESKPIVYRRNESSGALYTGLHLETHEPERLISLILKHGSLKNDSSPHSQTKPITRAGKC